MQSGGNVQMGMGGSAKSGSKDGDGRRAPGRPHDIQCYECGLLGHIRRNCPNFNVRGQKQSLNGIGKPRTPSANPK
jgi:hypothetical protein